MTLKPHWRCPTCGYDLYGLSGDPITCPECGAKRSRAELRTFIAWPPRRIPSAIVASFLAGAGWFYGTSVVFSLTSPGAIGAWEAVILIAVIGLPPVLAALLGYWRPYCVAFIAAALPAVPLFHLFISLVSETRAPRLFRAVIFFLVGVVLVYLVTLLLVALGAAIRTWSERRRELRPNPR